MNNTFLMLAVRMRPGFGVSVVIEALSKRLISRGFQVVVGCLEKEGDYDELTVVEVEPTSEAIRELADIHKACAVIAHTTPFFELLPTLHGIPTWAWEHGDPSPEFFMEDSEERKKIANAKRSNVYANVTGVIAISHFIKADIGWPTAHVIHNGWEHVTLGGQPDIPEFFPGKMHERKLRVGTLLRMGVGEAYYKGIDVYLEMVRLAKQQVENVEFFVMGRATEEDALPFAEEGITVFRNATDAERAAYLTGLDVFFSPSLWEGCNLPLVEAQAIGTVGLALDIGAHPEHTPFCIPSISSAAKKIEMYSENKGLAMRHGELCKEFVTTRFSWDRSVDKFLELVLPSVRF